MHKNLVKFSHAVFELCEHQSDKQTDKQTYTSQYFALLPMLSNNETNYVYSVPLGVMLSKLNGSVLIMIS